MCNGSLLSKCILLNCVYCEELCFSLWFDSLYSTPEIFGEQSAALVGVHVLEDPVAVSISVIVVVVLSLCHKAVLLKGLAGEDACNK